MNNDFEQLLSEYRKTWSELVKASSLDEIEERYMIADDAREEALNWIFESLEEEQPEYFSKFGQFETNLVDEVGTIPVFDENFNIEDSFEEYETYYQRYGCMTPEYLLSWDTETVLWTDGLEVERVKRPDVLMGTPD